MITVLFGIVLFINIVVKWCSTLIRDSVTFQNRLLWLIIRNERIRRVEFSKIWSCADSRKHYPSHPGGGSTPRNLLGWGGGYAARFSKPCPYLRPKYVIFRYLFQTCPLKFVQFSDVVSRNHTWFQTFGPKWLNLYPVSLQNGSKSILFGAAVDLMKLSIFTKLITVSHVYERNSLVSGKIPLLEYSGYQMEGSKSDTEVPNDAFREN